MKVQSFSDVYTRVSQWNALRYAREYNKELAAKLLHEELDEFLTGTTEVARLDGLADTTYVAFGVIWKYNVSSDTIAECFDRAFNFVDELPQYMHTYACYAKSSVAGLQHGADPVQMAANIIVLCSAEACDTLHMTVDEFIAALGVVCDSNDSKKIVRVASDVKANANDKGALFIAPEPRLQQILDNRKVKVKVN